MIRLWCWLVGHDWDGHAHPHYPRPQCRRCGAWCNLRIDEACWALRFLFIICALSFALASCLVSAEVDAVVTAYCGDDFSGITSTGIDTDQRPYGIAAAPALLPYGTKISVPGYRGGAWTAVDDTGGAMRRDATRGIVHIDLRFPTHWEAVQWGERKMKITVAQ